MKNKAPHDVRLVFMAAAWLLAHRGHFLMDVETDRIDKISNISELFQNLMSWFDTREYARPFECNPEQFGEIITNEKRKQERERKFKELLWNGKNPEQNEDCPIDSAKLIKLLSGLKVKLSELFCNPEYDEIEHNSISLADGNFDETAEALCSEIDSDDMELVRVAKSIYDWGQLVNILNGKEFISEAKVEVYETHKKDLKILKRLVKKYVPKKYFEIFRKADGNLNNYVKYSANLKNADLGKADKFKNCVCEDFCKYIKGVFKEVVPDEEDKSDFEYMQSVLEINSFCPKQVTGGNCVIPYQLYYCELKKILDNAKAYLPFLNEKDKYGTAADKILSIMKFRVPYYVGPLVNLEGNDTSWIVRKAGKIYPWNFDEMVDKDKSEEEFIRRMTAKCTYIASEDVLPKNSLLYCKFSVLNEINNIRINGTRLDTAVKQGIYNNVFLKHKKVTLKKIKDYLTSTGNFTEGKDKLEGIDISVKSSLKPYLDFRNLLQNGVLSENQAEDIIARITVTTDKNRLKKWLKTNYPLSDSDVKCIANLGYTDYGRLSKRFLSELPEVDAASGEVLGGTVIEQLWENSVNLMELLSDSRGFKWQLVETRQSTKAVTVLLKEMFPETEIVYVKAGIVSEFRHENHMEKCREVNDLHHAKDAYLNIVLGNIYDTKFTKNPLNFIKENGGNNHNYSMKITSLLSHDIQRGNVTAWKKDETLAAVKKQMAKNNIRFVRYSFCQKGELFNQELLRKGHGQVPRKKGLDIKNYGGYQKSTITYYLLAKYKKGKKHTISLVPVDLRFAVNIKTLDDKVRFFSDYVEQNCKANLETVLLGGRKIKVNTLFEMDGFRAHLSGKTGGNVIFKCGMQLVVSQENEFYIKSWRRISRNIKTQRNLKTIRRLSQSMTKLPPSKISRSMTC